MRFNDLGIGEELVTRGATSFKRTSRTFSRDDVQVRGPSCSNVFKISSGWIFDTLATWLANFDPLSLAGAR
jgi:hypothetical protein